MLYITCDHAGLQFKKEIINYFQDVNLEYIDLGPDQFSEQDDYPNYVKRLMEVFKPEEDLAFLICGSGQGMCIAANKYENIRAAQAWSTQTAMTARNDDNCNVLCLGERVENIDSPSEIVDAFLNTNFDATERRLRRLKEIEEISN
jgi:ribose 5-phosphate isomerase B